MRKQQSLQISQFFKNFQYILGKIILIKVALKPMFKLNYYKIDMNI